MADGPDKAAGRGADWITIWQSEWAAMAHDRELAEAWVRWVDRAAAAATRLVPDGPPGRARPDAPAWPPPAMAASDDALARLAERVAALERGRDAGSAATDRES